MTFSPAVVPGYYVAPIQIEDYARDDPFTVLSSVPLQFYFQVANVAITDPSLSTGGPMVNCRTMPHLIAPFPVCVSVRNGDTVNVTTGARMGSFAARYGIHLTLFCDGCLYFVCNLQS